MSSFCQEVLNPQVLINGCLLYFVVDGFSVRVTQAPRKKNPSNLNNLELAFHGDVLKIA